MKRALISGAGGFLGSHLVRELGRRWEVIGAGRSENQPRESIDWLRIEDEANGLAGAVTRIQPDLLVHAAFLNQKEPGWSEEEYLQRMQATNFRLFERCARLKVPVILISSSAVYGSGGPDGGLDEETPRRPVSLYGLAKAVQEMLAERLAVSRGLELCIVRLFNLVGPGKAAGTVVPDWVAQVTAIMDGAEPVLRVKNRATSRDFVDVRDAARAVELVARRFVPDEVFNVASGQTVSLREVSDYLESLCPVPYRTVEADARCGSGDILYQFGDATRIAKAHGWAPTIGWKQSVREYWDHYLAARRDGETPSD